jgi:hypothetical protein
VMSGIHGRRWDTVTKYLSSDTVALRDGKRFTGHHASDIMLAVHSLLRYALVDKLADAIGLPKHPNLPVVPRSTICKPPEKLRLVCLSSHMHNFTYL